MIKLKVLEMHCEKCVERINKVLDDAKIAHEVSLEEKTVKVSLKDKEKAMEELDDIGFDSEEI